MRVLPAGPDAVLLDFSDDADPSAAALSAAHVLTDARDAAGSGLGSITDLIPSAQSLLVQAHHGAGIDTLGIHRELRSAREGMTSGSVAPEPIEIPVVYDGDDLGEVADMLGIGVDDVVTRHVDTQWQVQFMGFAPGFGYLVPQDHSIPHAFEGVGRREQSRPRVPAGSVAVAAGYSAVYPRASPGGWYLLGRTDVVLWEQHWPTPALLSPGRLVQFVQVRR